MSIEVIASIFNAAIPITPVQKYVLIALANYADRAGKNVFPAVKTVMSITGLSRASVQRSIRELQSVGLLILVAHASQHFPREYRISVDSLGRLPRITSHEGRDPRREEPQREAPQVQTTRRERQARHIERQQRQSEAQSVINRHEPSALRKLGEQISGQNMKMTWASYLESEPSAKPLLNEVAKALATTRTRGVISSSVLDQLAQKFQPYSFDQVISACRVPHPVSWTLSRPQL